MSSNNTISPYTRTAAQEQNPEDRSNSSNNARRTARITENTPNTRFSSGTFIPRTSISNVAQTRIPVGSNNQSRSTSTPTNFQTRIQVDDPNRK